MARGSDYACKPPKSSRHKAAADTTESAIAGIRRSLLKLCMTPVKSMRSKIISTGLMEPERDSRIEVLVEMATTKIKPMIEHANKAILRVLMFSGVKDVMASA